MLRDITLGQYYSADSFLHRLDPRVKIRFTLFYIIVSLFDRNLPFFLLLTAICVLEVLLSKVPVRYILKGMRGILVFIFVCSALNIFTTRGEALIAPTRIYVKALKSIKNAGVTIKGCSHITGGGFYENIPRMLPDGVAAKIQKDSYEIPPIFKLLAKTGGIEEQMMYNTYNMGLGMVLAHVYNWIAWRKYYEGKRENERTVRK